VGLGELPLWVIVLLLSLFVCFLTEITSNTATSNVLLPIIGALGVAIKVHPLVLMIPATLCCSFAFCLPMATPPNLLAFATGKITMVRPFLPTMDRSFTLSPTHSALFLLTNSFAQVEMVKTGFFINIAAVVVSTLASFTIFPAVLGFNVNDFPAWALPK
jgi:sodium-dependent dicarboxylate transporter 2/3/5